MRRVLLAFICSILSLGSAVAGETAWVETDFSRLRLISEQDQLGDGAPIHFGLQLEMGQGWKSYWRAPGDAGLPPSFDWQEASSNVASVDFLFPAPHRFTLFGLDTFGYEGEVVFPLRVTPINPAEPMTLAGHAFYMVCEEICIPFEADLSMALLPGEAQPARQAYLIGKYLEQVPGDGSEDGLILSEVRLEGDPIKPRLLAKVTGQAAFTALDLLVEGPEGYSFRQPEIVLAADGKEAELTLSIVKGPQVGVPLEGAALTLTLLDGVKGLEANLVPQVAFGSGDGTLFWQALLLALLGGLILNVMPCVLPVLSMKLLSLVGQGGREKREIRLSFLFTTLGILVSFLALAGVVLALKAGGGAFGWGVQFQEPVFLAAMAAVTTFFSASLFGFFSIQLPGALADLGARHHAHGHGGQFLTGLFAVLLATPCTAPFVTPAVGFALTHGTLEILAIFLALGLGLSSPYLLVAAFPGLAHRLPRPGRWILKVKFVLGLALVGTAIWLLSVLLEQVGWTITLVTAGLLALLLALLGFWRQRQGIAVAALVALMAAALPAVLPASQRDSALPDGWVAFDRARIAEEVAAGSVVFVDVTAAWCVTCLANKALVLERAEVVEALSQDGVLAMQADWTRPDAAIRQFLTDNGRFGIPFNIIYGPGAPEGLVLPEILSVGAVLDGLAAAR